MAIWVREDLTSTPIVLDNYCVEKHFELCGVAIGSVRVIVCYRSPGATDDLKIFQNNLQIVLDLVYKPNSVLCVIGDFNIDPVRDPQEFFN